MKPLFRSKADRDFVKRINKELIERVIGQKILYYPVSVQFSEIDDLYGESKKKVVDSPVEIPCLVNWLDQEPSTGRFGHDVVYHSEVYILDEHLDQFLIEPKEGDFFEFGEIRFEITEITTPQLIFAKENDELGKKMIARSVRKETFEISVTSSVDEPKLTNPDDKGDLKTIYDDAIFAHSSSVK